MSVQHSPKSSKSPRVLIVIAVLIVSWVLLRAYAQSGVNAYNDCYWKAVANTDAAKKATIDAGYSSNDATKASFDIYADQVAYCSKQRPPDLVILITGVQAKDSH